MIRSLLLLTLLTTIAAAAESKGSCPALPPLMLKKSLMIKPSPSYRPDPASQFAGTVQLEIVVNQKGYVCNVRLLRGFDNVADERAVSSARDWHLHPWQFRGQPVAVTVMADVNFWRKPNGALIQVPESWNDPGK